LNSPKKLSNDINDYLSVGKIELKDLDEDITNGMTKLDKSMKNKLSYLLSIRNRRNALKSQDEYVDNTVSLKPIQTI